MHNKLTFAMLFCILNSANYANEPAPNIDEVADGIYVRLGHHGVGFIDQNIANIGFIIGEQCVAIIDTGGSVDEGSLCHT